MMQDFISAAGFQARMDHIIATTKGDPGKRQELTGALMWTMLYQMPEYRPALDRLAMVEREGRGK